MPLGPGCFPFKVAKLSPLVQLVLMQARGRPESAARPEEDLLLVGENGGLGLAYLGTAVGERRAQAGFVDTEWVFFTPKAWGLSDHLGTAGSSAVDHCSHSLLLKAPC
jgi:hypothetical protein